MRVAARNWNGVKVHTNLADAVSGKLLECDSEEGRLENISEQVTNTAEAVGHLVEKLVTLRVLTIDDASEICGDYSLEELDEE